MRNIEFRGKSVDHNTWVYGDLLSYKNPYGVLLGTSIRDENWHEINVKKESVGQYTGRKDNNGVKIFEGDIVGYDEGSSYQVFWDNGVSGYLLSGTTGDYKLSEVHNKTVVGNVYDREDE